MRAGYKGNEKLKLCGMIVSILILVALMIIILVSYINSNSKKNINEENEAPPQDTPTYEFP